MAGLVVQAAGCNGTGVAPSPTSPVVVVFAAASLGRVVDGLRTAYAPSAHVTVNASTGSSTALRVQIEQGARADVYLSADTTNPDALVAEGLTDGGAVTFARNGLALIVPAGNPARITALADIARLGVRVIAAGDEVPITGYAAKALARWASQPGSDAGFAAAYNRNVVSREDSVGAVVTKIQLGEGDAAIVYATDAAGTAGIEAIVLPPEVDVIATYAGVVPATASDRAGGHALLLWLAGHDGQAFLAAFGFQASP